MVKVDGQELYTQAEVEALVRQIHDEIVAEKDSPRANNGGHGDRYYNRALVAVKVATERFLTPTVPQNEAGWEEWNQ
jgi:hypothetical protein